jgi:glycosyltransferase involved in cell wall biosynthesis
VAEAQACGLPVIVGQSNGNSDYLCERDIHLSDYNSSTLSEAFFRISSLLHQERVFDFFKSRQFAETVFALPEVVCLLENALEKAHILRSE